MRETKGNGLGNLSSAPRSEILDKNVLSFIIKPSKSEEAKKGLYLAPGYS
jgi:hypothetical protein